MKKEKQLDTQLARLNELHREIEEAALIFLRACHRAVEAGEILIELKKTQQHGKWLLFLKERVSFLSVRTIEHYMDAFRHRHLLKDSWENPRLPLARKSSSVTNLTEFYRLIAEERNPTLALIADAEAESRIGRESPPPPKIVETAQPEPSEREPIHAVVIEEMPPSDSGPMREFLGNVGAEPPEEKTGPIGIVPDEPEDSRPEGPPLSELWNAAYKAMRELDERKDELENKQQEKWTRKTIREQFKPMANRLGRLHEAARTWG